MVADLLMKTELRLTQPNEDQPVTSSLQFDVIIELQIAGFGFVQFKPDLVSERAGSTFFPTLRRFKYYRNVAPLTQRLIFVAD